MSILFLTFTLLTTIICAITFGSMSSFADYVGEKVDTDKWPARLIFELAQISRTHEIVKGIVAAWGIINLMAFTFALFGEIL